MAISEEFKQKIKEELKLHGKWTDPDWGVTLIWMNGWIQFSSRQCGINFSSVETFTEWFSKQSLDFEMSEEMKTPDEGAFMASMDAWSREGYREDQIEFSIYYSEINQVSSWDNYHYEVNERGVIETWMDFFELDAPPKKQEKHYSFEEYIANGANYGILQYIEAEGLSSIHVSLRKFDFSDSSKLFEADIFLKDIFEKIVYQFTKKPAKSNHWNELRQRYREGGRFYHNLIHIFKVYHELESVKKEVNDWETLILAVLYHDIIYDVSRHDNEEQSANFVKTLFSGRKVNSLRVNRCVQHILATKNHQLTNDHDTNLLLDADLSILGASPEVYLQYSKAIREEHSLFPDHEFYPGRKLILEKFLLKDTIFKTEAFKKLENYARKNIENEILEIAQMVNLLPKS